MAIFTYSALDVAERALCGTLTADTPAEGRQKLREKGLRVVSFAPARTASRRWVNVPRSRARRQDQVAEIARHLALLLRAGVPLSEGLEVLTRQPAGRLTAILKSVRDRVCGGDGLADALCSHPDWFDPLFVSAVRVGELSGQLDESLHELAESLRSQQALRGQLATALAYPMILACVSVCVVVFLMSYVVPELLSVLAASGRPLPAATRLLKAGSDLLVARWPVLLLIAALGFGTGVWILRTRKGRRGVQLFALRVPVLGSLLQRGLVARFCQQMAVLLKTGIPFVDAVRSVAALSRNVVLAEELTAVAKAVESGSDIAPTLERSRIFPPVVVHLVAVGQDSGELTHMLSELKDRYETEVRLAIAKFTAALEPLLIVLLAGVVGFVVFACLMPILEATKAIQ